MITFVSGMISQKTIEEFYKSATAQLPEGIGKEIGHFNVFETEKLFDKKTGSRIMPYSRRAYYKISLIRGLTSTQNAAERISSLFIELLERQFPIDSAEQRLDLRTPKDYANRLAVHVNHLNKVLKEITGLTTTEIINQRVLQEAKILIKQTDWNISEIAYVLGFDDLAHFSHFFKKQTSLAPLAFRS